MIEDMKYYINNIPTMIKYNIYVKIILSCHAVMLLNTIIIHSFIIIER